METRIWLTSNTTIYATQSMFSNPSTSGRSGRRLAWRAARSGDHNKMAAIVCRRPNESAAAAAATCRSKPPVGQRPGQQWPGEPGQTSVRECSTIWQTLLKLVDFLSGRVQARPAWLTLSAGHRGGVRCTKGSS